MKNYTFQNQLFLASSSQSRKKLLQDAQIPFSLISQNADESQCCQKQSVESLVRQLAVLKMDHIVLPQGHQNQIAFFLTADTMTCLSDGTMYGKPSSREEAIEMLHACRAGATVGTAFCLERKQFVDNAWVVQERIVDYAQAWCIVDIPDTFLDFYLDRVPFLSISGAISIEAIGEQFVKEIRGNYSAILGLPMYQVRQALDELGFY